MASDISINLAKLANINKQPSLVELQNQLTTKIKQSFSKREIECLYYLMKGKTARETSIHLNLSPRTVEYYLDTLKEKLACRKKSEIIEIVLQWLS